LLSHVIRQVESQLDQRAPPAPLRDPVHPQDSTPFHVDASASQPVTSLSPPCYPRRAAPDPYTGSHQ
jgi:hypothetical protein